MKYLHNALSSLQALGFKTDVPNSPVIPLLEIIEKYDQQKVTDIAMVMQHTSVINETIRNHIKGLNVSDRYKDIAAAFDSIRDDAKKMVDSMEDGHLDWKERLSIAWQKALRGSIPDRFQTIQKIFHEVSDDTKKQITTETTILTAYGDFRMAFKTASIYSQELVDVALKSLARTWADLSRINDSLENFQGSDVERSRLELSRDEQVRRVQEEDKAYQVVKDISEDLRVSYNTTELIMARLQQSLTVKDRLYQRALSFFATNEIVFSGLSASFSSLQGLSEATKTMEAMKNGVNESLNTLAKIGGKQLDMALQTSYGPTHKVETVKALVESIVAFQKNSYDLIEALRLESAKSVQEIDQATEEGKKQFSRIVSRGAQ